MEKFPQRQVYYLHTTDDYYYLFHHHSGNKPELISILKQKDKEFLIKYLKDILPLQQWLVKSKMGRSVLTSADDAQLVVCNIKNLEVTKECYRQLGVNNSLKEDVMDAVAALFQLRDDRISDSHHSVNSNKNNYRLWLRTKYLSASFWRVLLEGAKSIDEVKVEYFFGENWKVEEYRYIVIYLNCFDPNAVDPWAMLRVDLVTHSIEYIDGRIDGRQPVIPALNVFLYLVKDLLQPLLLSLVPGFVNDWQCGVFCHTYFELLENQYDSGIYVTAVTYFLSRGVPLFFDRTSVTRLRMNLAYWILVGELPI